VDTAPEPIQNIQDSIQTINWAKNAIKFLQLVQREIQTDDSTSEALGNALLSLNEIQEIPENLECPEINIVLAKINVLILKESKRLLKSIHLKDIPKLSEDPIPQLIVLKVLSKTLATQQLKKAAVM
jgi:hypothetical protein